MDGFRTDACRKDSFAAFCSVEVGGTVSEVPPADLPRSAGGFTNPIDPNPAFRKLALASETYPSPQAGQVEKSR